MYRENQGPMSGTLRGGEYFICDIGGTIRDNQYSKLVWLSRFYNLQLSSLLRYVLPQGS